MGSNEESTVGKVITCKGTNISHHIHTSVLKAMKNLQKIGYSKRKNSSTTSLVSSGEI
jgi:hypothetical protein